MKFELTDKELKTAREWMESHDETHHKDGAYAGAIGGQFTFCFTGTSLGEITKVKCNLCSTPEESEKAQIASRVLTDFSEW